MMQQFATSSSKLAVSSLPVSIERGPSPSDSAQTNLSDTRSAFEIAMERAESSPWRENAKDYVFDYDARNQAERTTNQSSDAHTADTSTNNTRASDSGNDVVDTRADNGQSAGQANGKSEPNSEDAVASENIQPTASAQNAEVDSSVDQVKVVAEDQTSDKAFRVGETDPLKQERVEVDFDYVNFVSMIQDATEGVNQGNETQQMALQGDLSGDETSSDLIKLSLTQEELQSILNAQEAGLDLNESLSEEQLQALDSAINSMLMQYQTQQESDGTARGLGNEASKADELDKALLQSLIQSGRPDGQDGSENDSPIDVQTKQNNIMGPLNADKLNAASKLSGDKSNLMEQISKLDGMKQSEGSTELSPEALSQTQLMDEISDTDVLLDNSRSINASGTQASLSSQNAQLNLNPDNLDDKAILKQMAMLDERSQLNTLENIKSRVEKFASELSGSGKGNEFIAAMQTGLKEFKEQLQSGREPGIDLKAIVSDALAQSNVEIPPQNQGKIDNALTQFSGILNLANSLSQSTQAQPLQLAGAVEAQMIKESNVALTEGTKLAQQTQSAFDKAVNIFKPEGQQQLTDKVRWMVTGRNPAAEIRLDPPELGSMQIKVNMNSEAASVSFVVQSSQAKEALDQQLPRLREMLQEQGIELGQSSVQQDSSGQAQQDEQYAQGSGNSANQVEAEISADGPSAGVIEQRVAGSQLGGIDYYA